MTKIGMAKVKISKAHPHTKNFEEQPPKFYSMQLVSEILNEMNFLH